jgi:4-amino-4-deoxy-L-arabinose transferase-like glycosyltransferase
MTKSQIPNPEFQDSSPATARLSFVICHFSFTVRLWALLLPLLLFAFALRLYRLDAQSIWWDEAISVYLSTSTLAEIVVNRAGNLHPPLYFLLLKGWVALAGTSPFSVRFLSAWSNTLLIPGLYVFGRRWLGRRAGLIAATLAAISPLYLVYAQEARVYAILPLVYLVLLALVRQLSLPAGRSDWRHWLLLATVEVLALGLHYISFLAIAYVLTTLIVRLHRRRAELMRLLAVQGLVILCLLPWLMAVLRHADALTTRLGMSNWRAEPVTPAHYLRLLWTFQLTGLTGLIADPAAIGLTFGVALLMVGALIPTLASRTARQTLADRLFDWLVPLAAAFVAWRFRPLSHPRYVILFTPALLLLFAGTLDRLLDSARFARSLAALLAAVLVATSALGLFWYHTPRFAKDDARGTASAIAARSTADDLVLVPPEDWSVPYYYPGPARVKMVWPGDGPADWEHLITLTRETTAVFLVDYYRATRDPRSLQPFALESAGSLSERLSFKGLRVRVYELDQPVTPPRLSPADADFGTLRLTAAWIEPGPPANTAVALALRWRAEEPTGDRYRVGLRLRDPDGWELAADDDWLLDTDALPGDRWTAGQEFTTYHTLPLAPGTPPLTYTLSLGIYSTDDEDIIHPLDLLDAAGNPRGQSFDVGTVTLAPALGLDKDPYGVAPGLPQLSEPAELADGLLLEAAALEPRTAAPGQSVFVTLRWHAVTSPLPDLRPALTLAQENSRLLTIEGAPSGGRYPTDRWQAGEVVLEHRRVSIPSTVIGGSVEVAIELEDRRVVLGSVEVAAGEHVFTPPPIANEVHVQFGGRPGDPDQATAELLGYDLAPGPYTSGQPILLTLYWHARAGAASADYTIFTHVLAEDGHLVAQHDGSPANGMRPTPGWLADEIIVDPHDMTFREPYTGPARIEVGLYNPTTLERVPTESGDTFVLLPTTLTILEP